MVAIQDCLLVEDRQVAFTPRKKIISLHAHHLFSSVTRFPLLLLPRPLAMAPHEEEKEAPPLEGPLMERTDTAGCNHHDLMEKKERAEEEERQVPAEGGVLGGPSTDEIMLDLDGEDLLFSDDTFPSLPDFPCVSSPKGSPSPPGNHHPCLSNSSSSSSSSWPFLRASAASDASMQQQHPAEDAMAGTAPDQQQAENGGLQIPDDIDLLDLTSDPWDPSCLLFPDENLMIDADAATPAADQPQQHQIMPEADQFGESFISAAAGTEGPSAELANIFLEWLKCNKDSISPEDLRSIKLKRATIECAARRLGGGMHGRTQLVKLILAWVQNHHLQKRRRRHRQQQQQLHLHDRSGSGGCGGGGGGGGFTSLSYIQYQQQPFSALNQQVPILSDPPINPNPNLDFNSFECSSWAPYPDPGTPSPFPTMIGYGGGEQQLSPGTPAGPYHYPTSSIVVSSQPFSPSPDFHAADATATWPPPPLHFPVTPSPYSQFLGPPSPLPITGPQYSGGALASQFTGQRLAGFSSATKEARKKRMARQRRFSSLHQHRNQQQLLHQQQQQQQVRKSSHQGQASSRPPAVGSSSSSRANPRSTSWAFWSPFPASSQQANINTAASPALNPPDMQPPPPPPRPATPPPPPARQQHTQRQSTTAEKRQGWKTEKNLRFLLQKVLKQSDVGGLGRIVLPKKEAEIHLPELDARDGISIPMEDIGTSRIWNMKYRFWPNNKSRMYLLENTGEFVRTNGLQEGDFIVIYSDIKCGKYMIRGVKVRQPAEVRGAGGGRNAAKLPKKAGPEKAAAGASKSKSTAVVRGEDCDDDKQYSWPLTECGGWDSPSTGWED